MLTHALLALAHAYLAPELSSRYHVKCDNNGPASCSLDGEDTCCYEGSNGVFLQTQFWDYNPGTGPSDSFTIHGLWSDKCSGGYNQFCQPEWEISNAPEILTKHGLSDLLDTMNKFWKNYDGPDAELWEHEFNKHGTCMATLNPNCYCGCASQDNQNAADFFSTVVNLWSSLPTYKWLTEAGYTPDENKTYTVAEIEDAIAKYFNGYKPYLGCDSNNNLQEVWYFFSLKGSVAAGAFTSTESITPTTCKDGMKWVPKSF